ncbi:DUF757-domain-containing protein [Rhizoclosmatium globosum]|uniref:DUF757-domain-containing protein n=1 Tax=Rhizoclosmatium globosum TaxID=329046 RepID=A0A1Y2CUU0_9FUNG|nr:hypothetical protein HDU79_005523 [Rhizoclosmatium sp. JEL0117]ORY50808.1 DUF757-domain-containing protein [Rhizoclosmatium globosum]|eukprot:ORY50808.1 DUF757-domain-containing protein [Rhizoclosmatium globosum]
MSIEVKEVKPFSAETAENHEDVEKIWVVKAMHHAETYFKLISSLDASKIRLTKVDDEIYADFKATFPEINVASLNEMDDFKTDAAKEKWRNWIKKFEAKVQDFNYGTLLRNRAAEDYGPDNTFFVTRVQFYAIEIARNKEGHNSVLSKK